MAPSSQAAAHGALAVLLIQAAVVIAQNAQINHGYRSSRAWLPRDDVLTQPTGAELVATRALPAHWDWRNVGGTSYVASDVNQHIPKYCGSCWIHGTVAALNDRLKIFRGGAFPDVMISRQAVLNCVPGENASLPNPGCDGGDAFQIHKYLHNNRVPDESCMPYQAANEACTPYNVCRNCAPTSIALPGVPSGCFSVPGWQGYKVGDYGQLKGEEAMMKEIFARGPIACNMACDVAFVRDYSDIALKHEGVFVVDTDFNDTDHVVSVTGWGETLGGIKYWIVRNSWGTYWGDVGWFKIRRGVNQNLIESGCDWAVPEFPDLDKAIHGQILGSYALGAHLVSSGAHDIDDSHTRAHMIDSPSLASIASATKQGPRAAGLQLSWEGIGGLDVSSVLVGACLGGAMAAAAAFVIVGSTPRRLPKQKGLLG